MKSDEILAVPESDTEGCVTINRLVHEKLGLCWHVWETEAGTYRRHKVPPLYLRCSHCLARLPSTNYGPPLNPDYTHDIKAAWAIKEWLDKNLDPQRHKMSAMWRFSSAFDTYIADPNVWASPLDRCKAFLLMDEVKE